MLLPFLAGLVIYYVYYVMFATYPAQWKATVKMRLLCLLTTTIHVIIDILTICLRPVGVGKIVILRWFYDRTKLFRVKGIDVAIENWNGVPVYMFKSQEVIPKRSGIVYLHGGGWCAVNVQMYSSLLSFMAKRTQAVIVAPTYSKAPEHPFPAAFDDCYAVATRFISQATEFGVDRSRIAITGDSAGGNLAAAVTHKLSNDKESPGKPVVQYLIYPSLQFSVYNLPSQIENRHDALLSQEKINYFKLCYLGFADNERISKSIFHHGHLIENGKIDADFLSHADPRKVPERFKKPLALTGEIPLSVSIIASESLTEIERNKLKRLMKNPLLSPLSATDEELKNLPKTFIVTCSADVLRDEGILYYERMRNIGANVSLIHLDKMTHGAFMFAKHVIGKSIDDDADQYVSKYMTTLRDCLASRDTFDKE